MGSTKIIVVQLKELIKTALFVLLGIAVIALLIYLFIPKDKADTESLYTPGTYTSQVTLHSDQVSVEVTVNKERITKIELKDMAETQEVFFPLVKPTMETLAKEIIEKQSTDVAVSTITPITSQVLLAAVNDALTQAYNPVY